MAVYRIEESTLREMANSIRSMTGKTDDIVVGNMSTEIITKTEDLDGEITAQNTLISDQDAKIAELAEILSSKAGGGSGGGGSVETCTVILKRVGMIGTNRLLYTNGNMAVTEGTLTQSGKAFSGTFEVAKGTLLYTFFSDSGGAAVIEGEAEAKAYNVFAINGDATIDS